MNLYAYVGGDPVNWVDPDGLAATDVIRPIPRPLPRPITLPKPIIIGGGFAGIDGPLPIGDIIGAIIIAGYIIDNLTDDDECDDIDEFCRQQKQGCIEACSDMIWDPDRRHVHGGSMQQCINNCLPTICGGEGIWKGYK